MGTKRGLSPLNKFNLWIKRQSLRVKIFLGVILALVSLVALRVFVRDSKYFFIGAESVHAAGIAILIYKLTAKKTCSGLSLKFQELTGIYLTTRLICSYVIEGDIHTILDSLTLGATLWVIYMMRFKLKSTYNKELDSMPMPYVLVPCAIVATLINPGSFQLVIRFMWSFCCCLEAVAVLPQIFYMQNAKMVEPFTGHYVFALGVSRFIGCAYWIFQLYDTKYNYLFMFGQGYFWVFLLLILEVVQTFILADFCYLYVKSAMAGQLLVRLPPSPL